MLSSSSSAVAVGASSVFSSEAKNGTFIDRHVEGVEHILLLLVLVVDTRLDMEEVEGANAVTLDELARSVTAAAIFIIEIYKIY